jgi:hypothetical protein
MSLLQSGITKSLAESYEIDNSLRFEDGDTAYLNRTPSVAGDRKTWTWSSWVKRGNLGSVQNIFVFGAANSDQVTLSIHTDKLSYSVIHGNVTTVEYVTTQVLRDPSAWYHVVVTGDTTPVSPLFKMYVNGEQVTDFGTSTNSAAQDGEYAANNTVVHTIGNRGFLTSQLFDGYLAEVFWIDGTALDADSFGELSSTTNQWIPLDGDDVKDAVAFGTNGFYQKYNSTELDNSFEDSSSGIFQGSDFSAVTTTMSIGTGTIGQIIDGTTTASSGCIPTGSQTVSAQNVTFDCGSGVTKIFTHAEFILSNTYDDGAWKWQGSNDNVSYSDIGSGNFTIQGSTAEGPPIDITAGLSSNTTAYRYYRWQGVSGTTTASNWWTEIVNLRTAPPGTGFHTITVEGDTYNQRPQPHTVTANGDAHLIGPKQGTTALAFDGTGDYLSTPDSADWTFGTGDFTLEAWVNQPSAAETMLFSQYEDASNRWYLNLDNRVAQQSVAFYNHGAGTSIGTNTGVWPGTQQWVHLAFVRASGVMKVYVDGVSQTLATNTNASADLTDIAATLQIGAYNGGDILNGYMDSIRISNSARYTDTFTPPTSAFVSDSNTKFLLQSGADGTQTPTTDTGNTGHTITYNGDVRWFAPKVGAGAMAFDGTGDYLACGTSDDWDIGDGDFTMECWIKFNTLPTTGLGSEPRFMTSSNDSWFFRIAYVGSNHRLEFGTPTTDPFTAFYGTVTSFSTNQWYHVAVSRTGSGDTNLKLFVDGVDQSASEQAGSWDYDISTSNLFIGGDASAASTGRLLDGYIDGVRISRTARYTSGGFTLPTTAFTDDINTVLILNADINQGAWAEDQSTGLAISTDSRMAFDGTGDYLTVPDSLDWTFGADDFTVEMWVKFDAINTYNALIGHFYNSGGADLKSWFIRYNSDGTILFRYTTDGSTEIDLLSSDAGLTTGRWYHLAITRQSTNIRYYVDGVQLDTDGIATASIADASVLLYIGAYVGSSALHFLDGNMDELRISNSNRYPDGTTFTPKARGEQFTADANTLLLIHSDWTGGLGADSSGNYNAFAVTNLVATDQMPDTPTRNWCTLNPLDKRGTLTLSEGNLKGVTNLTDPKVRATIAIPQTGKWYWEFLAQYSTSIMIGADDQTNDGSSWYVNNATVLYNSGNGYKYNFSAASSYGDSWTTGDIIGVALNRTDNEITFYKNNSAQPTLTMGGTAAQRARLMPFLGTGTGGTDGGGTFNFGQDSSFAGAKTAQGNKDSNDQDEVDFYYTPPTDYLALLAENLSDPDIKLPGENFNTIIWSGAQSGSSAPDRSFTGVGFQPDFVWSKSRSNANQHNLQNSVATLGDSLNSDATAVAGDTKGSGYLSSLDSDGFTSTAGASGVINWDESGRTYVAWNWKAGGAPTVDNSAGAGAVPTAGSVKIDGSNLGSALAGDIAATRLSANTTAGFSIVKFQNNATSGATVAHGLGVTPELIITKMIDGTYSWYTYCKYMYTTAPEDYYMELNETGGKADSATDGWNDTLPTSSVFSLGDGGSNSLGSKNVIAYCFTSIEGYSKVGSYEGNGNADGTFIYTGFKPAYFMFKQTDGADDWFIMDNKRNTYNLVDDHLKANTSAAGATSSAGDCDFVSNGIKFRVNDNGNGSGSDYIYLAFASHPFKIAQTRGKLCGTVIH